MLKDLIELWTNQEVIEYMSTRGSHCATTFNLWRSSEPNQDCFLKKSKVRKDIPFQLPSEYRLCWSWAKVVKNQLNQAKALNNEIIVNIKLIEDSKAAANNCLAFLWQIFRDEKMAIEQTPVKHQYYARRLMKEELCADFDATNIKN